MITLGAEYAFDISELHLPELKSFEQFAESLDDNSRKSVDLSCLKSRKTIIYQKESPTPKHTGDKLREAGLHMLFKSIETYGRFLNNIDYMRRQDPVFGISNTINTTKNINGIYSEISQYTINFNRLIFNEISNKYHSINEQYDTDKTIVAAGKNFATHGFDLSYPHEIQRAIDEKRIIPFPRVKDTEPQRN